MSGPPPRRPWPDPPARRRPVDNAAAIAALVFVAVVPAVLLVLGHPAEDGGVGGRGPTVEQRDR